MLTLLVAGGHAPILQHAAPAIIERVNRFFGYPAVTCLSIRQGALPDAPRIVRKPPPPPSAEIGDSLRSIGDPELRECLEALAREVAGAATIPILGRVR